MIRKLVFVGLVSLLVCPRLAAGTSDSGVGSAVLSPEEEAAWWDALTQEERTNLRMLFEPSWFNDIPRASRIAYARVAQTLYDFAESGADSNPHDFYIGFAPLLLRTSFHSSGTYDYPTGTGGSNGGTIFEQGELDDPENGCISTATDALQELLRGSAIVPLADAVVIAGVVALDVMGFPRMDLVQLSGGRVDVSNLAYRDRLSSADDDALTHFSVNYNLEVDELVALIGGAHNFGSAHGLCSGYIGQWTSDPLSWGSPMNGGPEFFVDLMREDWRWYEICTYADATSTYVSIPDPFANGLPEEEEEEEHEADACAVANLEEPVICEEQAMRGCEFEDGLYPASQSPCDINLLQFRLKSDFFLKANPITRPHSQAFADDPDLLALKFGTAYHKLTHNGLDRCGLSGYGCGNSRRLECVTTEDEDGGFLFSQCALADRGGGRGDGDNGGGRGDGDNGGGRGDGDNDGGNGRAFWN